MDFNTLAHERFSVRKYADKPVEEEKLNAILEAGRVAPTASNYQPQRVLVIKSPEALEKLKKCTSCHFNAPVVLLTCCDHDESWNRRYDDLDSELIDGSIVTANMMYAAWELGLGSCWVMFFDPFELRKQFNLPRNFVPVSLLPLGYAAEDAAPTAGHTNKKPLSETVFYDTF